MTTTVFKNETKINQEGVINAFRNYLQESYEKSFGRSEIEQLVEIMSKNPTDKFVVTDLPNVPVMQGDLLIWSSLIPEFENAENSLIEIEETNNPILQETDSVTGDHKFIPLPETNYTITNCTFEVEIGDFIAPYNCKLVESDKPFLIFHREHGNLALPAGKYLVCSSLDASTLEKMVD